MIQPAEKGMRTRSVVVPPAVSTLEAPGVGLMVDGPTEPTVDVAADAKPCSTNATAPEGSQSTDGQHACETPLLAGRLQDSASRLAGPALEPSLLDRRLDPLRGRCEVGWYRIHAVGANCRTGRSGWSRAWKVWLVGPQQASAAVFDTLEEALFELARRCGPCSLMRCSQVHVVLSPMIAASCVHRYQLLFGITLFDSDEEMRASITKELELIDEAGHGKSLVSLKTVVGHVPAYAAYAGECQRSPRHASNLDRRMASDRQRGRPSDEPAAKRPRTSAHRSGPLHTDELGDIYRVEALVSRERLSLPPPWLRAIALTSGLPCAPPQLAARQMDGSRQFLVRWQDYDADEDTWEGATPCAAPSLPPAILLPTVISFCCWIHDPCACRRGEHSRPDADQHVRRGCSTHVGHCPRALAGSPPCPWTCRSLDAAHRAARPRACAGTISRECMCLCWSLSQLSLTGSPPCPWTPPRRRTRRLLRRRHRSPARGRSRLWRRLLRWLLRLRNRTRRRRWWRRLLRQRQQRLDRPDGARSRGSPGALPFRGSGQQEASRRRWGCRRLQRCSMTQHIAP